MKRFIKNLLIGLLSVTAGAALFAACGQTPCEEHTPSKNRIITEETHSVVCADCGETISTQEHTFGAWHERTAATCETDGEEYTLCSGCGYESKRVIPAKEHSNALYLQTEETHMLYCEDCEAPIGEAALHEISEWVTKLEPTCQSEGIAVGTCSVCGDVIKQIPVVACEPQEELGYDDDGHWQICSMCKKEIDGTYAVHTVVNGDCVCGYHEPTIAELVDFVVDVPVGRDPIVLQLSDTQIIDAGQTRPGRDGVDYNYWATDQVEERCYDYVKETVETVKPDLIILTGDVVYGEFDDSGTALIGFINFMESLKTPWAPVFGNHDNESKKGVDWQCDQLEAATYCLFKQRELTGNGNYSVGITQGGKLLRAFYMLDTNACGNASAESLANGHTRNDIVGFAQDQIDWYTQAITRLHQFHSATKISFAYHIQQYVFAEAYAKYGFDQSKKYQDINIDTHEDKAESDFGYIGRQLKGPWDTDKSVWRGMKALGTDSIFVGHEHCNSSSVVYDGVRLQFGQKSSTYDRANYVNMTSGKIEGSYSAIGTPLVGGTVIVLSEGDGVIADAYIYLCEEAGGNIDWDQWKTYEVNGLQLGSANVGDMWGDGAVGAISTKFDDTVNAHKVEATSQGKLYVNTQLLRGKTTLSFTIYVPSSSTANLAGMGAFAIRIKPDDEVTATLPNVTNASGKYYIIYKTTYSDPVKLEYDVWKTYTIDISNIAATCTEFSFLVAAGNVVWLRDVTVS